MPRQLHKLISKEDPKKRINLSALGYQQALEEALDILGWRIRSEWDAPYNKRSEVKCMKSLNSQQNTNNTNPET